MVAARAAIPYSGASRHHHRAEIYVNLRMYVVRVDACAHACRLDHAMQMHVQEMHNVAVGAIACLTCTSAIAHLHRRVMRCL